MDEELKQFAEWLWEQGYFNDGTYGYETPQGLVEQYKVKETSS